MISSAVKSKSIEVKGKVKDYMGQTGFTELTQATSRLFTLPNSPLFFYLFFLVNSHVSKQDKVDNLYRQNNQASVFSLDGDEEDDGK